MPKKFLCSESLHKDVQDVLDTLYKVAYIQNEINNMQFVVLNLETTFKPLFLWTNVVLAYQKWWH